ncbi:hypothetical protein CMUS01_14251 [Colletotrichum musicola]|uniref:Uncharacterized protein n=1 Tax=Colletotrichum musicola TaxID=2175873 RepID=A0A8H6J697_9PEZI|nr:hypothetical protein CMUS01_14251 [Colletotrichum musicola]
MCYVGEQVGLSIEAPSRLMRRQTRGSHSILGGPASESGEGGQLQDAVTGVEAFAAGPEPQPHNDIARRALTHRAAGAPGAQAGSLPCRQTLRHHHARIAAPPNHRRRVSHVESSLSPPVTMTTPATADLASGLALIHALLEP